MTVSILPAEYVNTDALLPGDPLMAQAALVRAACAHGVSRIRNTPHHDPDTATLCAALSELGCGIIINNDTITLHAPENGLLRQNHTLHLGNAGYALRLLTGLLCGRGVACTLEADPPLSRRNVARALVPLQELGAHVACTDRGTPPVYTFAARPDTGKPAQINLPLPNAFVKGAALVAAYAGGIPLRLSEPQPSRDYAERMFGLEFGMKDGLYVVEVCGGGSLPQPVDITLPPDTFLADHRAVIAILRGDSAPGLLQAGSALQSLFTALQSGANYQADPRTNYGLEHALPLMAVLAGCYNGSGGLTVRGAMNMRQQQCDRIAAIVDNAGAFGVHTAEYDDGFFVESGGLARGHGAHISAYDDPVIAAAMIALCAVCGGSCTLYDVPENDPRIRTLLQMTGAVVITDEE